MSKTPFLPDPKNQIQLQRTPEKTSRQSVKKMKKKKKTLRRENKVEPFEEHHGERQ
jgi:hypothetical protein